MSGKQEIGISELSSLFGITPEAIRKYEEKGIVQAKREERNKYRKYTSWEIFSMIHARRFSQMGFTLGQTAELLKTSDGQEYIQSIEELQVKLAREVARKRKIIMLLDQKKKERCSLVFQEDRIQIERLDETLYFEMMQQCELNNQIDEREWSEWIDVLPFTSEYLIFDRENRSMYCAGFAIRKSDAILYGFENLKATRVIPEGLCATCILKGDYDELIMEKKIGETAERIEKKGYRIVGEIVAEIFDFAKVNGKYEALHKCYFPIEI